MRIRLLGILAGPSGVWQPGIVDPSTVGISEAEALDLVARGQAELLEGPKQAGPAQAALPPKNVERAVEPKRRRK